MKKFLALMVCVVIVTVVGTQLILNAECNSTRYAKTFWVDSINADEVVLIDEDGFTWAIDNDGNYQIDMKVESVMDTMGTENPFDDYIKWTKQSGWM